MKRFTPLPLSLIFILLCVTHSSLGETNRYYAKPPFLGPDIPPIVVVMFDNSGSMKFPMYWDPSLGRAWCSSGVHKDFNPNFTYYGIFDPKKNYKYDPSIPVHEEAWTSGPYYINGDIDDSAKGAFVESNCTPVLGSNCWSGNFLNWLVTRRIDAARMVLVGGKVEHRGGYDYDGDGKKEWKILGNNEPEDKDFCKTYNGSEAVSPFPSGASYRVYSPADSGKEQSKFYPYSLLCVEDLENYVLVDDTGKAIGEIGVIRELTHQWKPVRMLLRYNDPVVVVGPPSYNGKDPVTIRIKNLTTNSFKVRLQEWRKEDGTHTGETVFYMVVEKGVHRFPNGKMLVADVESVPTGNCQTRDRNTTFDQAFSSAPVVIVSLVHDDKKKCDSSQDSVPECHPMVSRLSNVNASGFRFRIQKEDNTSCAAPVDLHYIALEQGKWTLENGISFSVKLLGIDNPDGKKWYDLDFSLHNKCSPYLLATIQTYNGHDTVYLRHKNLSCSKVSMCLEEPPTKDGKHPKKEKVGVLVIGVPCYNIAVLVDSEPKGLLHSVYNKVRLGISFYNYNANSDNIYDKNKKNGGTFILKIPKNPFVKKPDSFRSINSTIGAKLNDLVDAIEHYPLVWGTTPLAENLYEVAIYFQQTTPYYENTDFTPNPGGPKDPFFYPEYNSTLWCAKPFVIIFTDGEPWRDSNIPSLPECSGKDCDKDEEDPVNLFCKEAYGDDKNKVADYLDDVAYWMHNIGLDWGNETERGENPNKKIYPTIYTVIFGVDDKCRRYHNKAGCENHGCLWDDNTCWPTNKKERCRIKIALDTAKNGGGEYYHAAEGFALKEALSKIFQEIVNKSLSRSSVSVLSGETQEGGNLIRAVFYQKKTSSNSTSSNSTEIKWIGNLNSLWVYRGTTVESISIREDTDEDKALSLSDDYKLQCTNSGVKKCKDSDGDGLCDTNPIDIDYDDIKAVWNAGEFLLNIPPSDRKIFTNVDCNGDGVIDKSDEFDLRCINKISPYLMAYNSTYDNETIIKYVRGIDTEGTRNRSIKGKVWKLGDIIYSNPQVVRYYNYSVVYVGSNDGMLHAFKIGRQRVIGSAIWNVGKHFIELCDEKISGQCQKRELGKEIWAFIPKNALPYLKYLLDPNYDHMYYVDLTPFVFRTFKDGQLKTILIGGMRLGGAVGCTKEGKCIPPESYGGKCVYSDGSLKDCDKDGDQKADPGIVGLSSYFAIDVTDPENPRLLWEFTDPNLGFSYSGPAVFTYNNKYYIAFGSGPTKYDGQSSQSLRIFILKLKDDFTIDRIIKINTRKTRAFAGQFFRMKTDISRNNPFFFGFISKNNRTGKWEGGVLKLYPNSENEWIVESALEKINNKKIGPISAPIEEVSFRGEKWLLFGEGRYFTPSDDMDSKRYIYAVKASCLTGSSADLDMLEGEDTYLIEWCPDNIRECGWYIPLKEKEGNYGSERLVTPPVGIVSRNQRDSLFVFLSFQPTRDPCSYGGRTFVRILKTLCPGAINKIEGKLLLQLSTGVIAEISTENPPSNPYQGLPPLMIGGGEEGGGRGGPFIEPLKEAPKFKLLFPPLEH